MNDTYTKEQFFTIWKNIKEDIKKKYKHNQEIDENNSTEQHLEYLDNLFENKSSNKTAVIKDINKNMRRTILSAFHPDKYDQNSKKKEQFKKFTDIIINDYIKNFQAIIKNANQKKQNEALAIIKEKKEALTDIEKKISLLGIKKNLQKIDIIVQKKMITLPKDEIDEFNDFFKKYKENIYFLTDLLFGEAFFNAYEFQNQKVEALSKKTLDEILISLNQEQINKKIHCIDEIIKKFEKNNSDDIALKYNTFFDEYKKNVHFLGDKKFSLDFFNAYPENLTSYLLKNIKNYLLQIIDSIDNLVKEIRENEIKATAEINLDDLINEYETKNLYRIQSNLLAIKYKENSDKLIIKTKKYPFLKNTLPILLLSVTGIAFSNLCCKTKSKIFKIFWGSFIGTTIGLSFNYLKKRIRFKKNKSIT